MTPKAFVKKIKTERAQEKRSAVSIYINLKLWNRFKRNCTEHDVAASAVVESLMKSFLGDPLEKTK